MRDLKIIEELLSSNRYCSIEHLARLLDVSTRTMRSDLKYLQKAGESNGFLIHQKRRSGFSIEITDKERFERYRKSCEQNVPCIAGERLSTIIAHLLLTQDYITQEALAEQLNVSKSIIKVDMGKAEEELQRQHIHLEKKAHYGQKIDAALLQRRMYLLKLYEEGNPYVASVVDHLAEETKIRALEEELIRLLKEFRLETNYIELKKLDAFLKISLYLCSYHFHEESRQINDIKEPYKELTRKLADSVESIFALTLAQEALDSIALFLQQSTKPASISLYNKELEEDIEHFLEQADKRFKTSFNEDEEFKRSLLAHVSLLIDRLHQKISFSNPLVKEISVRYPVIFNICIQFAEMLEANYHVNATRDEIGFIATHFAAHMEKELHQKLNSFERIAIVCSSGGGSAFLIKLKLEAVFSSSEIRTFSLLEMEELWQYQPDIIFTIQELKESFDVPIVVIKELLDDEDIRNIKSMFEFGRLHSLAKQRSFGSLFRKDAFYIFEKGSYHELLKQMGADMERLGYCEKGYGAYVMERERVLSTIYNNGVAIPHPVEMCGRENMISVGVVRPSLTEEGKEVKLIFMVNLKKGDLKLHQGITRALFEVMADQELVDMLQKSAAFEEFVKSINHIRLEGGSI